MLKEKEKLSVGALLYAPALHKGVAESVIRNKFEAPYSLALCLEDTVGDEYIEQAEAAVLETVQTIYEAAFRGKAFYLPKLFVRVRSPEQVKGMFQRLEPFLDVLTGFIFPKYGPKTVAAYHAAMAETKSRKPLWVMPILESADLIPLYTRYDMLQLLKERMDRFSDSILNVRVGGNDFCNAFAARRHYDETIYDVLPVGQLLGDILTTFSRDYVVSGPVWEFFASDNDEWKQGLRQELKRDRLAGFVGKTVIHPKQIPAVNEMLRVSQKDLADAKAVLDWDDDAVLVRKSQAGERMNEVRTHKVWARRTALLGELYGVV